MSDTERRQIERLLTLNPSPGDMAGMEGRLTVMSIECVNCGSPHHSRCVPPSPDHQYMDEATFISTMAAMYAERKVIAGDLAEIERFVKAVIHNDDLTEYEGVPSINLFIGAIVMDWECARTGGDPLQRWAESVDKFS